MNSSLQTFYHWFWISLVATLIVGALLLLLTRRRALWLRYVAAEALFWTQLGLPQRWVEPSRRFEESRTFTMIAALLFAVLLVLTALHGGAYLYFKGKMAVLQPQPHQVLKVSHGVAGAPKIAQKPSPPKR